MDIAHTSTRRTAVRLAARSPCTYPRRPADGASPRASLPSRIRSNVYLHHGGILCVGSAPASGIMTCLVQGVALSEGSSFASASAYKRPEPMYMIPPSSLVRLNQPLTTHVDMVGDGSLHSARAINSPRGCLAHHLVPSSACPGSSHMLPRRSILHGVFRIPPTT